MWSFRKTKRTIDELHFKDSYSALEHACKYMECRWEQDSVLPAIVKKVSVMSDGRQKFLLLVANEKKPREPVYAESLNKQVPYMNQEDFVGFMVCNIPSPYPDLAVIPSPVTITPLRFQEIPG